jgi:hypothetical protein
MLYSKASYDISGVTGDWLLTTSTANVPGYGYTQNMGYVYENSAAHTLPVYQFSKPADHYYIAGQNTLNGFSFNIITEDLTIPYKVYEYWSPSQTDHLYTTSSIDKRTAYVSNSVPFKVFKGQVAETVPIYSFWNVSDNDNLYSKSNVSTIGGGLWAKAGIAFYAYETLGNGRVPIYEYWSSESTDHYYTTENTRLISGQWVNGGIAFYALPSNNLPPPVPVVYGGMPNDLKPYAKENGLMPTVAKTLIYANDTTPILTVGSSIYSPNQQYRITLQTDGNVVIYKKTGATTEQGIWSTRTQNSDPKPQALFFQTDANLVLYLGNNINTTPIWTSQRYTHLGFNLTGTNAVYALQDDGNFVFYWKYTENGQEKTWVLASSDTQNGLSPHSGNLLH